MRNLRRLAHRIVFFSAVALLLLFPEGSGLADSKSVATLGVNRENIQGAIQGPWNIEAASLTYDQASQVYTAEGAVRITSGDRVIQADWASVDMEKRQAELRGKVFLQYGKNWLKGEHVFWNLDKETGWLDGGLIYFAENQFYARGKSITKSGPNQYELKDGFMTSCDPDNSDWKIRYDEMKVNLDGFAWATQSSFWVKDVPVFYLPAVGLPVQENRQSGFLLPWGGYSNLNGADMEVPFYWAIRPDMDLTFYGRYMSERGWMSGAEYRINNPTWGEGIWLFNYLQDQAGKQFLSDQGYPYQTNERYWARARHSFDLPGDIEGRLDVDYVSDRNFLQEFGKGSVSYDTSNTLFRESFGRGILDDKSSPTRESALYMDKHGESYLVGLDIRYWEQLVGSQNEFTLQRLPALSYSLIPSWVGTSPLYYTVDSSMVNYWSNEADKGQRLDLTPRLYYPMHWKNFLDIEPSIGVRSSGYSVDWQSGSWQQWQGRVAPDVQLDMSTRLNRVYPINFGDYVAVEHSIRPQITYQYVPDPLEGHLPRFDRYDDDPFRNALKYGVTSFLTGKEVRQDSEGNSVTNYREFFRMEVYELFNIEKPGTEDSFFDFNENQGFTTVGTRIDVMPKRFIMLSYDANVYSDDPEGRRQDFLVTLDNGKGQTVRFDYEFSKGDIPINEFSAELVLKTLPNLYLNTYHDYSFDQGQMYKQGYGVKYLHGCWALGVAYERENSDQQVIVSLNLLGLGNVLGSVGYKGGDSSSGSPF